MYSLVDGQFISAGAAKHRGLHPFNLRPGRSCRVCMDGSVLAANVVKDLKGFICRVLSVVNAMNSTAHD
jgi:hypothetical protein